MPSLFFITTLTIPNITCDNAWDPKTKILVFYNHVVAFILLIGEWAINLRSNNDTSYSDEIDAIVNV